MDKIKCNYCGKTFLRDKGDYDRKRYKGSYCDLQCKANAYKTSVTKPCGWCGKSVTTYLAEYKRSKSGYIFCNRSCAVSYNNTQKRKSRRSKCERLLCDLLVAEFPSLKIDPTNKTMLDGYEVDIAIPDLKLGIEWNGVVHFKPIYGQTKLDNIQKRDIEKQKIASQKGINLIVVPDLVSTKAKVKEAFADICKIIRNQL